MRRSLSSILGIALAVAATAGCAGAPTGKTSATVSPATTTAFRQLAVQPPELSRAETLALQRCLRRHGFDPPRPQATAGSVANLPLPLDASAAALHGYGDALDRRPPGAETDLLESYRTTLPAAAQAAFAQALDGPAASQAQFTTPNGWVVGASRSGCAAQARAEVYGSVDDWLVLFYLPQDLNGAAADVYLDPPVVSALESYRTCMASQGQPVQFPQDAVELAQRSVQGGSTEPSPAERDIAAADSDCQHSSKILAECLTSLERRTTPWITANTTLINYAGNIIRRSLPRAKAILAGPPG